MNRRQFLGSLSLGSALTGRSKLPEVEARSIQQPGSIGVPSFELDELMIDDLQRAMQTGRYTARRICELYLARIEATNRRGPMLGAVIETNPDAITIAEGLDDERKQGRIRGPLHGIPVLLKANIGTA